MALDTTEGLYCNGLCWIESDTKLREIFSWFIYILLKFMY